MGTVIEISFGKSSALINNEGAALVGLVLDGEVIIPNISDPTSVYAGTILAPWPNRIKGGRYYFNGETLELDKKDELGNAIHGLIGNQLAEVSAVSANRVTLSSVVAPVAGYPFKVAITTSYELSENGLKVTHEATNKSNTRAPVGIGAHPYLPFDQSTTFELHVQTAAVHGTDKLPGAYIAATELGLGSGLEAKVADLVLDTQFGGLQLTQPGVVATLRSDAGQVDFWVDGANYLMIYTSRNFPWQDGVGNAMAIEPQTCAADAFNNGEGLVVLEPGETLKLGWGISFSLP
jgi:aldose 1-epimerase